MEEILKDDRFSHIFTDPRFRRIPKNVRKIKVDNRFKDMFKNKKFKEKCRVDERGRSLNLESSENLQKLYNMEEELNETEESEEDNTSDSSENKDKHSKSRKLKICRNIEKEKSSNIHLDLSKDEDCADRFEDSNEKDVDHHTSLNKVVKQKKVLKDKTSAKKANKSEYENTELNKASVLISEDVESKLKNRRKIKLCSNSNSNTSTKGMLKTDLDPRFTLRESDQENLSEISDDESVISHAKRKSLIKTKIESHENEDESDTSSSSNSEDSESEDSTGDKSDSFDHQWEEHHERAPDTDEITRRLAVCNMDWDRIRAVDLYAVFNSFKPPDTSISSVKIYPSEFGLKRMEEEKLNGPPELVEKTLGPDEEEEVEDKKLGRYHREKLRQYQMNRLKYYYAIVDCDTPETANSLYEQLNGMEYESSSVRFDLRFVPDDMEFEQEPTSASDNNPDLTEYKPRVFVTTALQQVKVGLTWDETDPQRRETLQKAFTEPDSIEKDIKEYLASSSGDSEDEIVDGEEHNVKLSTKERIEKYKALLESIDEQEKKKGEEKYEMEITWEPGAKEKTENLVKEKLEEKSITPFEELQKKKKEKLKLKKKEKKTKMDEGEVKDSVSEDSDSDNIPLEKTSKKNMERNDSKRTDELYLISDTKKIDEFNTRISKKMKKKKLKEKEQNTEDFKVDVNDPRFSAIYTSPLFNIDPSDPHFKSTPGNLAIIAEKQRRLKNKGKSQEGSPQYKKVKYN